MQTAGQHVGVGKPGTAGTTGVRLRTVMAWISSWPALAAGLLLVTLLASGPLQGLDQWLNRPWNDWLAPTTGPVLAEMIDPLASQKVALPLLGLVAVWLAWRRWTIRPVVVAAAIELSVAFLGSGMKLFFARASPKLMDPAFFDAGLISHGWRGISYPSGHAIEAVAMYGGIAFLVARYGSGSVRLVRLLTALTILVTVVTVFQSFYMGWHWTTDLVGGILAGLLILSVVGRVDGTR